MCGEQWWSQVACLCSCSQLQGWGSDKTQRGVLQINNYLDNNRTTRKIRNFICLFSVHLRLQWCSMFQTVLTHYDISSNCIMLRDLWVRVGKNVARLQNGDQAEAEADRKRPQPEFDYIHLTSMCKVKLNLISWYFSILLPRWCSGKAMLWSKRPGAKGRKADRNTSPWKVQDGPSGRD